MKLAIYRVAWLSRTARNNSLHRLEVGSVVDLQDVGAGSIKPRLTFAVARKACRWTVGCCGADMRGTDFDQACAGGGSIVLEVDAGVSSVEIDAELGFSNPCWRGSIICDRRTPAKNLNSHA